MNTSTLYVVMMLSWAEISRSTFWNMPVEARCCSSSSFESLIMIGRIVRFSIMAVANSSIDFWREVKVALSWLSRVDFVFASVARVQQQLRRRVKSVMYVTGW